MSSSDFAAMIIGRLLDYALHVPAAEPVQGLQFSYWDRGGPPGQGYESNFLQVLLEKTGIRLVFTKTRFDPILPPYRVEVFELAHRGQELAILKKVAEAQLFTKDYVEELSVPIGGVTKITFTLHAAGEKLEKTFYQKVPLDLQPLKREIEGLMKQCKEKGKKVAAPAPGAEAKSR